MPKSLLNAAAKEIADGLAMEMRSEGPIANPTAQVVDILLERLSRNVAGILRQAELGGVRRPAATGLQRRSSRRDLAEEATGGGAKGGSFPNLKYAKPKYKDVESLLNYVESDGDKVGLKLVIMNFND